jgi:tetratricopeptide (TPR) repeat protein
MFVRDHHAAYDAGMGPDLGGMVGRADTLIELGALAAAAGRGRGAVAVVRGEAGIGKSTLAEALVERAEGIGLTSVWGWCVPHESVTYLPWQAVLGRLGLDGLLYDHAAATSSLSRTAVHSAVCDALGGGGPLLIVLEDLHWADEATVELLHAVATRCRSMPVLVVATARDDPTEARPAVAAGIADLPTSVVRLRLTGLVASEVETLLGAILDEPASAELVDDVLRRTGGNPFYVREVGRLLRHQGVRGAVPAGAQEVLDRRLARLSQACHRLLEVAAVGGSDAIDVQALVVVAGTDSVSGAHAVLDEAVTAGLVHLDAGAYAFAHALVREVLVAGVAGADRGVLHAAYAAALEPMAAADPGSAAVVAEHWSLAARPDDRVRGGPWWLVAGRAAAARLGYETAIRAYQRALATRAVDRVEVLLDLGEAQLLAGEADGARASFLAAAKQARVDDRTTDLARAALGLGGGIAGFEVPLYDHEAVRVLRDALDALPPDHTALRAALHARLSVALTEFVSIDERVDLAQEGLRLAEMAGDVPVQVAALAAYCDAIAGPDHVADRLAAATRMRALAASVGDTVGVLLASRLRVVALCERGDFVAADQEIAEYTRIAERVGVPRYTWLPHIWRGMRALLSGDLAAARAEADAAETIGARADSTNATFMVFALRAAAHRTTGTLDAFAGEALAAIQPLMPVGAHTAMAVSGTWEFVPEVRARSMIADALAAIDEMPRDAEWVEVLWSLGRGALAHGLRDGIAAVHAALRPYPDLWAVDGIGGAVFGVVSDLLGRLATALGHAAEAQAWFGRAREAYRAKEAPLLLAALPVDDAPATPAPVPTAVEPAAMAHEGPLWRITFRQAEITLPDAKGLRDLAVLLRQPGREAHVLDLADPTGTVSAAATTPEPAIDAQARTAYRSRVVALADQIDDAEADGDSERAARLRTEQEYLVAELAGSLGLYGRTRSASADSAERARKAVTMRIRAAISSIAAAHPGLGRHLDVSVRTGRFCVYQPETPVVWRIT